MCPREACHTTLTILCSRGGCFYAFQCKDWLAIWRFNSGQIEAFVHGFPTEFRYIAMGHVHLLYDRAETSLFVVPLEDGEFKFPCPILSTRNALKFLVSNPQM